MEAIFHEQQEGSLCAQHCLNSLLQGQFYSAVDLAELAQELDNLEKAQMAVQGDSEEYRLFLQQPSINMDDTGFFSVQVISKALSVWGLELVAYSSSEPVAVRARQSPISASAYICNYREHWFTIRRLGSQWFNLNSLLEFPELVSNTYLGEFLAQLQQEGYSIFLIKGQLPECDADLVLQALEAEQAVRPRLLADIQSSGSGKGRRGSGNEGGTAGAGVRLGGSSGSNRDEEADIEAALMLSLAENIPGPDGGPATIDQDELQMALAMSRGGEESQVELAMAMSQSNQSGSSQISEEDELQKAISLSLSGNIGTLSSPFAPQSTSSGWGSRLQEQEAEEEEKYLLDQQKQEQEEEEEMRKALAMSLQADSKMDIEPPVANVGGILKHKKLTSPTDQRMDVDPPSQPKKEDKPKVSPKSSSTITAPGTSGKSSLVKASKMSSKMSSIIADSPAAGPSGSSTGGAGSSTGGAGSSTGGSGSASGPLSPTMPAVGGHTLGGAGAGGRRPTSASGTGETDPAEIRRRRLAFLEKMQK